MPDETPVRSEPDRAFEFVPGEETLAWHLRLTYPAFHRAHAGCRLAGWGPANFEELSASEPRPNFDAYRSCVHGLGAGTRAMLSAARPAVAGQPENRGR